ncbi:SMP-30/gluconolactonase/LRE family protein [Tamlana fucoidanivorans]|uniref:SMP-30/gluconolactonase/LRE family protein n=1 Tax=Allotamlana fucoidanivorans TaxID=2583814 RepID=A0A5C4SSI9_9FLAO|nr:SMP-30/gluconolactonase/LRE family protein [Tamlana fucoidanivorans]TNJ46581.1 SMP-30/gluconolactonase/LRE family protein [Tamlana fucoidanivorans]
MRYVQLITFFFLSICLISCKNSTKYASIETGNTSNHDDVKANFSIEILDQRALKLLNPNSKIEILASGFSWTEGPLWIDNENSLLFSDIPRNKIYKLNSINDTLTYLKPSGYTSEQVSEKEPGSNGLLLNHNKQLVLMQQGDRRIAMMNAPLNQPEPTYVTLVNNFQEKRLNSPNDGVFDSNGNLYFTDPCYGLPLMEEDPERELDFNGVYCLLTNGDLILLDKLSKPNGIALSQDETKLYVAVSDASHAVWYSYDIKAPARIENKQLFYDATEIVKEKGVHIGLPDGLTITSEDYIFATGPEGVWLFTNQGDVIAKICTGLKTSNCTLSTDEKRLFLTASSYILAVNLN